MQHQMIPTCVDSEEGIRLCAGNSAMYRRFLALFAQDSSVKKLKSSLASGQWQEAFLHAHTLKGLSAQLALPRLFTAADALCTCMRRTQGDCTACAQRALPALDAIYHETLCEINDYLSHPCP